MVVQTSSTNNTMKATQISSLLHSENHETQTSSTDDTVKYTQTSSTEDMLNATQTSSLLITP